MKCRLERKAPGVIYPSACEPAVADGAESGGRHDSYWARAT